MEKRPFGKIDSYIRSCREEGIRLLVEHGEPLAREMSPFTTLMVAPQFDLYHSRMVTRKSPDHFFYIPCIPGYTRRFCDVDGNYRVCERIDDSHAYKLGTVWTGPDPERLRRTMELRRHMGDCANCSAMKTCDICYARIPDSDAMDSGYDRLFDLQCQRTRMASKKFMASYVEIMERNNEAFGPLDGVRDPMQLKYGSQGADRNRMLMDQLRDENVSSNIMR